MQIIVRSSTRALTGVYACFVILIAGCDKPTTPPVYTSNISYADQGAETAIGRFCELVDGWGDLSNGYFVDHGRKNEADGEADRQRYINAVKVRRDKLKASLLAKGWSDLAADERVKSEAMGALNRKATRLQKIMGGK